MTGLKFLFKRSFFRWRMIIPAFVTIAMMVTVMAAHELKGTEDYLVCKMFGNLGTWMLLIFADMFLCVDMNGTRLLRSAPISKELRTFSAPMFNIILGMGMTVLINIAYVVFILISGNELYNITDMLISSAVVGFIVTVIGTVSLLINYGMLLILYAFIPLALLMNFIPKSVWSNGFGTELWVGIVVFAVFFVLSVAVSFISAKICYKKVDFNALPQNITPVK